MQENRPLSPHLSIYQMQMTAVSSIVGRLAGMYCYIVFAFVCLKTVCALYSYDGVSGMIYDYFGLLSSPNIVVALFTILMTTCTVFAFTYYVIAVVRHILWDFGYFLSAKSAEMFGHGMFGIAGIAAGITLVTLLGF